ncbi:MAG: hypothetical protein ABJA69_00505 [Acidobacteriaceae bacterium]
MSSLREATTPVEMTGYFEIEPLPQNRMNIIQHQMKSIETARITSPIAILHLS